VTLSPLALEAQQIITAAWASGSAQHLETQAVVALETAGRLVPAAGLTVYAARWAEDPIAPPLQLGLYTSQAAAKAHCEDELRLEHDDGTQLAIDWIGDTSEGDPIELVASDGDSPERPTGYVVIPLDVATVYDPDADR
jgi:hypothetical protein